jgi:uncharacterized membrane protein HdeD (DUF308 family)
MWWVVLLEGIAAVVIGILLVTDPSMTLVTLAIFLGVYWLIGGIFELVRLFLDHSQWGWKLVSGILGIIAGLVVVRNPMWAAVLVPATLVLVLGLLGLAIGIINIIRTFRGGGWQALIIGLLSLALGLIVLASNIVSTTIILVSVAAACAIVGGLAAIVYSFFLRRA